MNSQQHEITERIVQPTEVHDTLARVETLIRELDDPFVRVTIEPVTAEEHSANQALEEAIANTDECLNCGVELDEGGFCGLACLQAWGGS